MRTIIVIMLITCAVCLACTLLVLQKRNIELRDRHIAEQQAYIKELESIKLPTIKQIEGQNNE